MISFLKRISRYRILALFVVLVFALDQITKLLVVRNIDKNLESVPIIEGFLYFVHIGNTGAAWGMLQGFGIYLAVFAVITILFILFFRKVLFLHLISMQIVFGMLIGGILGNLYDRVTHKYVIDFIDVHLPFYQWPSFNIADSAICVGVFLYIIFSFRIESKLKKAKSNAS